MTARNEEMTYDGTKLDTWLAVRKREAHEIDVATAECGFREGIQGDPYGISGKECTRHEFVRNRDSEIWVAVSELPQVTRDRLFRRRQLCNAMFTSPEQHPAVSAALRAEYARRKGGVPSDHYDSVDQRQQAALNAILRGEWEYLRPYFPNLPRDQASEVSPEYVSAAHDILRGLPELADRFAEVQAQ